MTWCAVIGNMVPSKVGMLDCIFELIIVCVWVAGAGLGGARLHGPLVRVLAVDSLGQATLCQP